MERKERLEKLLQTIRENRHRESSFDSLHTMLLKEIRSEEEIESDPKKNPYLDKLQQTHSVHAGGIFFAKDLKSDDRKRLYKEFIYHFELDVRNALEQ